MAWNRKTNSYVPDEDVERWEEILQDEFCASDLLTEIINYLNIDEKATIFYNIATDYDIELTIEEEIELEDENNAG